MENRQADILIDVMKDIKKSLTDANEMNKRLMQPSNGSTIISKIHDELTGFNTNLKDLNKIIESGFADIVKAIEKSNKK